MAQIYSPFSGFNVGQTVTVTDPNDPVTPNKVGLVPVFAAATAGGGTQTAGTATDPTYATNTPSGTSGAAVTRQFTTVASGSLVVKASAGNLYGYACTSGGSAGYLMIFDSATVPADGTVTPKLVRAIAANSSIETDRDIAIRFTTGIVAVFSTTGPFTKTISNTAFLAGDAV